MVRLEGAVEEVQRAGCCSLCTPSPPSLGHDAQDASIAHTLRALGVVQEQRGNLDAAEERYNEALAMFRHV